MDFGPVFLDPVKPGDPGVQDAELHIPADFLGTDQARINFGVIHIREIGPGSHRNLEARFLEHGKRGVLKTPLGQPQYQLVHDVSFHKSAPFIRAKAAGY